MTHAPERPSLARKHTPRTKAKADDELSRGVSFVDLDGTRLNVTLGDVKGAHDAALVRATGYDFMGLLEALSRRQGLDLLAAVVWFGRLVHNRSEGESYEQVLESFGYGDVLAMDLDEAKSEGENPEA